METTVILPTLDTEKLQAKANEYAMKGAEDVLREFYTGYDSPYKKALQNNLVNKGIDSAIEIPDIIGILNESISKEIDIIANNAVSKTFVPMVKKFLTRAEAEIKLSDILEKFIEYTDFKDDKDKDKEAYTMEVIKDDGSFLYLSISSGEITFEIHFYLKSEKGISPKIYEIYTLPYITENSSSSSSYRRSPIEKIMKLSIDGVTLELPFTPKVLEDDFISYIAKLIIANTKITFNVEEFSDEMFPENECHCD